MSCMSNREALNEALSSLQRYIKFMTIPVDIQNVDEKYMEGYFETNDSKVEAQFEKLISVAAAEAIYVDNDIPVEFKPAIARRTASELQDAVRGAKIEYEFAVGKYGFGHSANRIYERKKKEIKLCRRTAVLEGVNLAQPDQHTKLEAKQSVWNSFAKAGYGVDVKIDSAIESVTDFAVDAAWRIMPSSKKEIVRTKIQDIGQKGCKIVKNTCVAISKSEVAKPIIKVVKKAAEVVDKYVAPIVESTFEVAKSIIKAGWNFLKSLFA